MNKTQQKLLSATKKELRKQLLLMVGLYLGGALGLLFANKTLFFELLAIVVIPGVLILSWGRRGVMFCIWRAFGLILDFLLIGVLAIYILSSKIGISFWNSVALNLIIALLGTIIIHYMRTIPYWQDTYELNLHRKKINLERGLFSVTISWAIRGSISNYKYILAPVVIIAGPSIAIMLRGSSGDIATYFMLSMSIIVIWGGLYSGSIELYNAYKLLQIEKQIGKALIIDAFAHEYGR